MLTRYRTAVDGEIFKLAHIYAQREHGIDRTHVDPDAIAVVSRLVASGHSAYVVGGAVRDLCTGKDPNDFDIATSARPRTIAKLFRRSRIVGRRFRIVHVYAGERKVFEVSTFRAVDPSKTVNNLYGTIEEDAIRRDFTVNALYYDPKTEQVLDFVDGYRDIKERRLRTISSAAESFLEDPVRMIRAVKYWVVSGFKLPQEYRRLIKENAYSLSTCSPERLTEEIFKILGSGRSAEIFADAHVLSLLGVLLPRVAEIIPTRQKFRDTTIYRQLHRLEENVGRSRSDASIRSDLLTALLEDVARSRPGWKKEGNPHTALVSLLKNSFRPLVLSNVDARRVARRLIVPNRQ